MASESSMDSFCGSKFWDTNKTWYSLDPDLTTCFQQTVLVWAPCAFLWVFSILELFYLRNSKTRDIPWNWNNGSRLALTGILIVLSVVDLIVALTKQNDDDIHPLHLYGPVIKIATFILAGSLVYFNKLHGLRASGLLFLFWFFMVLLSIPRCRTEARGRQYRDANNSENSWAEYQYISFMIFFASSILILLINCFGDAEPRESFYPKTNNPCPEVGASFLSRLFFGWFDSLAWKGFRNPLEDKDLWQMKPEDTSKEVYPLFSKYWLKTVAAKVSESETTTKATFSKDAASVNFIQPKPQKLASILPAICKAFGPTFLFGAFLKLFQDVLTFVSPQVLRLLINFIDSDEPEWKGILYAVLLFLVAAVQTLFLSQYFNRMFLVGLRIRTALISAIYRKALVMSNSSRKESTVGEIVNLMAVDAQRFMDLAAYINMLWSAPLQIALALFFLWEILGPSVLAGLAVMIILIPVNGVIANKVKILQIKQMKNKDERVKLMNEILSGIKVLKLYAWEPSFEDQVLKIRNKEVKVLKSAAYLNAGTSFIWSCAPFLVSDPAPNSVLIATFYNISERVSMVTFMTYVMSSEKNVLTVAKAFVCLTLFDIIKLPLALLPMLIVYMIEVALVTFATFVMVDEKNVLNATTAFVSLSLFNILRFPLSMLPMMISNMVQTSVSVKRLNKFMNCEELDPANVQHDPNEKYPLKIENGTFSWGGDTTVLRDINMTIEKQSLVAVVGSVGSGKSSLISAYLGEMDKIQGKVNTHGKIAYVSQQAWIQNATLKDNILFGSAYDKQTYDRVIVACALKPDIEMLPGGDQTEIGEKGINLSGGQKQRVSLARAVYNNADIYFLDDPLSAVDSHVGKHIFEQVIGPSGILGQKTRVLVTHGITYLPYVNHMYVLKDGEISESGGYKELLEKKGAFAEFLIQHLQEITESEEIDLDELKQQLDSNLVPDELRGKLVRAISRTRSDSVSDSESRRSSLTRQYSTDSTGDTGSLRRRVTEKTKSNIALDKDPSKDKLIEKETSETGSVKWEVYKHYLKSIGVFLSVVTIVLNMVFQGFSIGSNIWLSKWSSDPNAGTDTGLRDMYLGVYGAFGAGQALSSFVCDLTPQLGCLKAAVILHMKMLFGIFKAPLLFFDTTPSGRILSRFSKDVDVLDITLPQHISDIFYCLFEVVATVVVISISSPWFMTVILPIAVLYYLVQRFYVATSRQLKRLESVSRSPIYSHFGESITGTTTIRAYHVQERFVQESEDKVDFNQVCYFPSIIANRWLAVRLEMVGNLIILFAALFAVTGRDTMNAGLVGLSVSYALQITQTLNWLVRMTSDVETNIVAVERIKEYGETKQEAPWEIANVKLPANWPEMGRVEFKDYQVRYREGLDLVLKGISFTVNGGEKVGIVGRTGAGKSSLTLSLFRIIEAAGGYIFIDGQDISKLGLHALRSRLTIIPQDPVLFSGTLRINLDPFNKYNDDELWRALEHAHLKVFVKGLTAGLNHEVTEGGENLSVGQRQLICLARALLRKTKVLILDEATAAVDLETDDLIQKTIRTEFRDCTVLTIAHRLNTIMDSDKVLVLDKGQAIEFDLPQTLLQNRKSIFYGMAKDAGLV